MHLNKILLFFLVMIVLSTENCFAMTFSQPVKIGSMVHLNYGDGFRIDGATSNDGEIYDTSKSPRLSKVTLYLKGKARYGNGSDALYLYYDYKKDYVLFGGDNISNTVSVYPYLWDIYKIKTDSDITIYPLLFYYGPERDYIILGKQKNGKFVKYIDTINIAEKYFGFKKNSGPAPVFYTEFICKGDTLILKYQKQRAKNVSGEFRFKWDDSAQWFGIEQVVY